MNYKLAKEKCEKLKLLTKGFETMKEGDWCYVTYKDWVVTTPTQMNYVETTKESIFGDVVWMNMKNFPKDKRVVKIPSLDDFFEILDGDIKEIDYQNNTIISNKKEKTGHAFDNTIGERSVSISGSNLYEALYNMTMLLYSNEK